MNDIEGLICSQLRGSRPAWPGTLPSDAFTSLVEFHGVGGLLHLSEPAQWPLEVRQSVRSIALQQSMWELGHHRAAGIALEALDYAGLQPLVMKGTALAYSQYPVASARARGDTDILVQDRSGDSAKAALEHAGFSWVPSTGGSQATFVKEVCGVLHSIDLHWRFNNSPFLAKLFSHGDLRARAGALPAFGPRAKAVSAVDALLIACTHRLTHERNAYHVAGISHFSADRLIWLFDIHLLADALTASEWRELRQLAADRGLRAICAEGLRSAHARFGTARAPEALASLTPTAAPEAPARYFAAGSFRQWFMDLGASGDTFAKASYLRELVFPSREYMRARFGARRRWTLPLWYIRRSVAGAARRLARVVKS